jgi:hypothetical protein
MRISAGLSMPVAAVRASAPVASAGRRLRYPRNSQVIPRTSRRASANGIVDEDQGATSLAAWHGRHRSVSAVLKKNLGQEDLWSAVSGQLRVFRWRQPPERGWVGGGRPGTSNRARPRLSTSSYAPASGARSAVIGKTDAGRGCFHVSIWHDAGWKWGGGARALNACETLAAQQEPSPLEEARTRSAARDGDLAGVSHRFAPLGYRAGIA